MQEISETVLLAHLARLELSPERTEHFSVQLGSVFEFVSQMKDDKSAYHPERPLRAPLAPDAVRSAGDPLSVDCRALMAAVPLSHNNLIKVRAVL